MKKRVQFSSESNVRAFINAADYLSVAQIFLKENAMLRRPLESGDIKERLVGHFGTCHGIDVVYGYLTAWIKWISDSGQKPNALFILGDGHGLSALNANLFLEGSLTDFYGEKVNSHGVDWLCKNFSWPSGFPSHASPMSPGVICEGGELGYSLGIAFGAALGKPGLIVPCLIGDGESETASLLASLNLPRILNMQDNGMVLPILHLNGYKIGGPTIYGRLADNELLALFYGFGWNPIIIDEDKKTFHKDFSGVLREVWQVFQGLKKGQSLRPPLIIFRSRKGEGGLETLNGSKIAGNNLSHQVVLTKARSDKSQLDLLENWLKGYHFGKVFGENGLGEAAQSILPKKELRMGRNRLAFGGFETFSPISSQISEPKARPDFSQKTWHNQESGYMKDSSAARIGEVLRDLLVKDEKFRVFCPDEMESNKLGSVFEASGRSWQLPIKTWDKDLEQNGRAVEMLSENTLFSVLAGHTLTGRRGVLASYEAFAEIITSQTTQFVKFLMQKKGLAWWGRVPSLNVLLTSLGWRQDHNGFSHQNPGYIGERLMRPTGCENVFLPLGANSAKEAMEFCTDHSFDSVNTIVCGKTDEPQWFETDGLLQYCLGEGQGAFAIGNNDFDVSVWGIGDYVTNEAIRAMALIHENLPKIKMRFAGAMILSHDHFGLVGNQMTVKRFNDLAGKQPIVASFHGYAASIKPIFSSYCDVRKVKLSAYQEKGTTTTPLLLQILNRTDRFSVAVNILESAHQENKISKSELAKHKIKFLAMQAEAVDYAIKFGKDKDSLDTK